MDTETKTLEPLAIKPQRAAEMLECSRSTIYTLVRAGHLKAVKLSEGKKGSIRIITASIYDFLAYQPAEIPELTPAAKAAGAQFDAKRSSRAW